MADAPLAARSEILKIRKERVHSTMLVEVLALLIFMSMAFAFVLRDDALRTNTWKQKYDKLEIELKAVKRENVKLRREVVELERANRQLLRNITGTIPANDTLIITQDQWQELIARLANAEAIIEALEGENGGLRARLEGRGGSDLPNCRVSPTSYIVRIDLSPGGYSVTRRWPASSEPAAAQVPGLRELASGRTLSSGEFRRLAGQVKAWGRSQAVPCNFRADVYVHHSNMSAYRTQQSVIGDTFYATYR